MAKKTKTSTEAPAATKEKKQKAKFTLSAKGDKVRNLYNRINSNSNKENFVYKGSTPVEQLTAKRSIKQKDGSFKEKSYSGAEAVPVYLSRKYSVFGKTVAANDNEEVHDKVIAGVKEWLRNNPTLADQERNAQEILDFMRSAYMKGRTPGSGVARVKKEKMALSIDDL